MYKKSNLERPIDYFPQHKRKSYNYKNIKSYLDVPGWINDAAWIYEDIVKSLPDNAHIVEIGTYLGQSATRMAELLKQYNRSDVKFDSIDIFYLQHYSIVLRDDFDENTMTGVPPQFKKYVQDLQNLGIIILDICKHPLHQLGLIDYVNYICIDSHYAHKLYDDESLDFVWLDANHEYPYVFHELNTMWKKIKPNGILAGDDYNDIGVKTAVDNFLKENEVTEFKYNELSFYILK